MYWASLGGTGQLAALGCTGQCWVLLGSSRPYLAVLGCTGLYWAVLWCSGLLWATGLHWAALDWKGLYLAVLRSTGLYWSTGLNLAELGFPSLYWAVVVCTGLYWCGLGWNGEFWALMGCTGLSRWSKWSGDPCGPGAPGDIRGQVGWGDSSGRVVESVYRTPTSHSPNWKSLNLSIVVDVIVFRIFCSKKKYWLA